MSEELKSFSAREISDGLPYIGEYFQPDDLVYYKKQVDEFIANVKIELERTRKELENFREFSTRQMDDLQQENSKVRGKLEALKGKVRRWGSSIDQCRYSPRGGAKHMAISDLEAAEYDLRAAVEKEPDRWCETHDGPWGGKGSESCSVCFRAAVEDKPKEGG